jgi:hypothetical protein
MLEYYEYLRNADISERGGWNVKNQNIEGSDRQKYFLDDQNVKSQKIRILKVKLDF